MRNFRASRSSGADGPSSDSESVSGRSSPRFDVSLGFSAAPSVAGPDKDNDVGVLSVATAVLSLDSRPSSAASCTRSHYGRRASTPALRLAKSEWSAVPSTHLLASMPWMSAKSIYCTEAPPPRSPLRTASARMTPTPDGAGVPRDVTSLHISLLEV